MDPERAPAVDENPEHHGEEDIRWTIEDVRRARWGGQFVLSKLADLQGEVDKLNGWAVAFSRALDGEEAPLPPLVFPQPTSTAAAASSSAESFVPGEDKFAEHEVETLNAQS